jgi:hypothetical protein
MEDDLKKKKKEKKDNLKNNGIQTNQPKSTLLAVTPL